MKEDLDKIFWKRWIDADTLDRVEIVKQLNFMGVIRKDEASKKLFYTLLNSYFKDLYHATTKFKNG